MPRVEGFAEGYQSVPVDWGISSERKKGFFGLVKEVTAMCRAAHCDVGAFFRCWPAQGGAMCLLCAGGGPAVLFGGFLGGFFAGAEGDEGHGVEGEVGHQPAEGVDVDGEEGGHVLFEGAVFLVVDPLPADRAHAAEGDFAGEDEAGGDLVAGALDLVGVDVAGCGVCAIKRSRRRSNCGSVRASQ